MHKSDYEKHGKWFMDKAKSFKKFGFDIGENENGDYKCTIV